MVGFPFPERRRREHSNALKGIQDQQILIARDDRGTPACQRGRQYDIIVAVATSRGFEDAWLYKDERLRKEVRGIPHINRALAEFAIQDITKFIQQLLRGDNRMLADAVFQKLAAAATRNERGDQHVCVQEEFHETRVNTSWSV